MYCKYSSKAISEEGIRWCSVVISRKWTSDIGSQFLVRSNRSNRLGTWIAMAPAIIARVCIRWGSSSWISMLELTLFCRNFFGLMANVIILRINWIGAVCNCSAGDWGELLLVRASGCSVVFFIRPKTSGTESVLVNSISGAVEPISDGSVSKVCWRSDDGCGDVSVGLRILETTSIVRVAILIQATPIRPSERRE